MLETLKSVGFFSYGRVIPGLTLHGKPAPYPVLNERAIRAGAGMVFALGFFSFFQAFYLGHFEYIRFLVPFLFFDFLMKTVVGIRFSPVGMVANLIVKGQSPDYVGAVQKRFAWSIGLMLSGTMMVLIYGFGVQGWPNLAICGICLTFMFMESAFGICVGCKIYGLLLRIGWLPEPKHRPVCAGNVCAVE